MINPTSLQNWTETLILVIENSKILKFWSRDFLRQSTIEFDYRIQTLLRESVEFLNFGKLLWSCDSPFKVDPLLKIRAPLPQRGMIY